MTSVTMHDAKTNLSKYVALIESGAEDCIVIARGKSATPVAMLVAYQPRTTAKRLGVAEGAFDVPESIDQHNDEIAALFEGLE